MKAGLAVQLVCASTLQNLSFPWLPLTVIIYDSWSVKASRWWERREWVLSFFLRAEGLEGFADAVRQTLGLDVIIRLPIISVIPLLVFHLAAFKDCLWLAHFAISAPKNARGYFLTLLIRSGPVT